MTSTKPLNGNWSAPDAAGAETVAENDSAPPLTLKLPAVLAGFENVVVPPWTRVATPPPNLKAAEFDGSGTASEKSVMSAATGGTVTPETQVPVLPPAPEAELPAEPEAP